MIILILFFVGLAYLLFFSPLVFLFAAFFVASKKKKQLFLILFSFFLLIDAFIAYQARNISAFRKNVCQGEMLYRIPESITYKKFYTDVEPSSNLAIPGKFCSETCRQNLEKIKDKLKFKIIEESNNEKILPYMPSYGGTVVEVYEENGNKFYVFLNGSSDTEPEPGRRCRAGYFCITGFQLTNSIPEFAENLMEKIFNVKKQFNCEEHLSK
jgi:hypothetical protein